MPRPPSISLEQALAVLGTQANEWVAMRDLETGLPVARSTILRRLGEGITAGQIEARGNGPTREYRLIPRAPSTPQTEAPRGAGAQSLASVTGPSWSPESLELLRYVRLPRSQRTPVSYKPDLLENYQPNQTFWLPASLREKLNALGQIPGERALGTYVRDILDQLLIDLSWASSRLEGNEYSRLETKQLIEAGYEAHGKSRLDAIMILNHKKAIEFLAEIAPQNYPYEHVIANIHAQLMDGLMTNEDGLGCIRQRIVQIDGSVYLPLQSPHALEALYRKLCKNAQAIEDPVEAAFFLFTQLPYLQPFEDGNKRTARVSCNLPLTRANYAPLSFTEVSEQDYFGALLAIYERADVTVARDLFEWAYERSVMTYRAVKQSMREPDPFRVRLRSALSQAVHAVVAQGKTSEQAIEELKLSREDAPPFTQMLERELLKLTEYNFARYGLLFSEIQAWLKGSQTR